MSFMTAKQKMGGLAIGALLVTTAIVPAQDALAQAPCDPRLLQSNPAACGYGLGGGQNGVFVNMPNIGQQALRNQPDTRVDTGPLVEQQLRRLPRDLDRYNRDTKTNNNVLARDGQRGGREISRGIGALADGNIARGIGGIGSGASQFVFGLFRQKGNQYSDDQRVNQSFQVINDFSKINQGNSQNCQVVTVNINGQGVNQVYCSGQYGGPFNYNQQGAPAINPTNYFNQSAIGQQGQPIQGIGAPQQQPPTYRLQADPTFGY